MTIVYLQFISPQSAFINIGLGGEGSAGFRWGRGYFRPPGTFSFITGLAFLFSLLFVFYFWLSKYQFRRFYLSSYCSFNFALPLTISRTAVGALFWLVFAFIGSAASFKQLLKIVFTVFCFLFFTILQKTTSIFSLGTDFLSRVRYQWSKQRI
jgi:hypothetical protein